MVTVTAAPFKLDEKRDAMSVVFFSEIGLASHVMKEITGFTRKQGLHAAGFGIVLRELIMNAIAHGNKSDSSRSVAVYLNRCQDGMLKLTVEDEGDGFDYAGLDMSLPEEVVRMSKRGYKLINAFSEKLEFNAKGNRVAAYLKLEDEPQHTTG